MTPSSLVGKTLLRWNGTRSCKGCCSERYEATAGLKWHVECENPKDPQQKEDAQYLTKLIERIPWFWRLRMNALEAIWFGRQGVQLLVKKVPFQGGQAWNVVDHAPIRGDKIAFTYYLPDDHGAESLHSEGTPAIFVHASYQDRLQGATFVRTDINPALLLNSTYWRERFIIHKYLTRDRAVRGTGAGRADSRLRRAGSNLLDGLGSQGMAVECVGLHRPHRARGDVLPV